ncbi:MAG: AtpZ/AtpI family protein [Caulobacteraceae bacterium]
MPEPEDQRPDALQRLDERLEALRAGNERKPYRWDDSSSAGYRLVAELIGGVLSGLGFGWLADRFLGTSPWGLIVGTLAGAGLSVFVIARSAGQMAGKAEKTVAAPSVPDDADEDEPGGTGLI